MGEMKVGPLRSKKRSGDPTGKFFHFWCNLARIGDKVEGRGRTKVKKYFSSFLSVL